jgi:tetratricopeptide (TPR) repeat protein
MRGLAFIGILVAAAGARGGDVLRPLEPAIISLRPPRDLSPRQLVIKVRLYAAPDYRVQTVDAEAHFRQMLARINPAMRGWPGVRFEVESFHPWPIESSGAPMGELLSSLDKVDPGDDVDLVVGLATALPTFTGNLDTLGMAQLFGKHAVLRGLDDRLEFAPIGEYLMQHYKGTTQRDDLMARRGAHKEAVIFLHEWAHSLGALHVDDARDLMNPSYDIRQEYFSPADARILETVLRRRNEASPKWRDAARGDLLALVGKIDADRWVAGERESLLQRLGGSTKAAAPSLQPAKKQLTGDEKMLFQQAVEAANGGDLPGALPLLEKLATRLPDDNAVWWNWCAALGFVGDPRAEQACGRSAWLNPDDPRSALVVAKSRMDARDAKGARTWLFTAQDRLDALATKPDPRLWNRLAELWAMAHCPTLAERAASHGSPEDEPSLRDGIRRTRGRVGLPSGAADLPPEREFEYFDDVERVQFALDSKKWKVAEQLISELERRYPKLPAAPRARCRLDAGAGKLAQAEKECRAAIALDDNSAIAWRDLSHVLRFLKKNKAADEALQKAIALDPGLK